MSADKHIPLNWWRVAKIYAVILGIIGLGFWYPWALATLAGAGFLFLIAMTMADQNGGY